MASKFFRKAFEFVGKRGPTIKGVQPTKSKAVQDKIKLIKKAGKLQKKQGMDTYKKIGVDKVTKDIYKMDVPKSLRQKKMFGGIVDKFKTKIKKPKTEIKKGPMKAKPDNKGQKLTPDQSKTLREKPRDKRKPIDPKTKKDSLREKIVPKKKMDRLKQLREELK